jgi:hypothetical protein
MKGENKTEGKKSDTVPNYATIPGNASIAYTV